MFIAGAFNLVLYLMGTKNVWLYLLVCLMSGIGYTDNVLSTANITDSTLKRMYADSVLIPAVLFLLVFAILLFIYPLGKKQIAELQVQKEEALRKMMH